jgi:chaperonin GroEL (HSP60 family)
VQVDDEGGILVTNDGATILDFLNVQHPAARILVELSKSQVFLPVPLLLRVFVVA